MNDRPEVATRTVAAAGMTGPTVISGALVRAAPEARRPPVPAPWAAARLLLDGLARSASALDRSVAGPGRANHMAVDVLAGAGSIATETVARAGRVAGRVAAPVIGVLLRPPLVDARLRPERLLRRLAERGRAERRAATDDLDRLLRAMVPQVVAAVLDQLDLTALVLQRVNLDAVAASLDIAAVVERVDVNRIAEQIDLQAIVDRIDIDAIVARLDLDAIVATVDLDAIATRIDMQAIIDRIDIVSLADEVIDGVDLPEIIRQSTGSVASEAARTVRMRGIEADELVSRLADRLLLRRRARRTDAPGEPESLAAEAASAPPEHHPDGSAP